MKHYYVLSNEKRKCGGVGISTHSFDELESHKDWINAEHFYFSSGWNGVLDVPSLLEAHKLKLTGRNMTLTKPLIFRGTDYDMGKSYDWSVRYNTIWEAKKEQEE